MSFWADEKTGRLDELCCLLFPHRAKAEFLSLAPTPRHLGQFPQELKDEGTVGTRWRRRGGSVSQSEWEKRRHKRWIEKPEWRRRARESEREPEWRTQEESFTLGERWESLSGSAQTHEATGGEQVTTPSERFGLKYQTLLPEQSHCCDVPSTRNWAKTEAQLVPSPCL